MKADDGHFEYRRIDYFVVQIMMDFLCHITKFDAFFAGLKKFRPVLVLSWTMEGPKVPSEARRREAPERRGGGVWGGAP